MLIYFFYLGGRGKQGELGRFANGDRAFHSYRKFIGTKESVYIRIEFKYHRIGLEYQLGRRFIVLKHQYCHRDVMKTLCSNSMDKILKNTLLIGLLDLWSLPDLSEALCQHMISRKL